MAPRAISASKRGWGPARSIRVSEWSGRGPRFAGEGPHGPSGNQLLSMKLRSCLLRLGWRSLRRALASIWRMRSRVTSKS
jgi:hypothetical protein